MAHFNIRFCNSANIAFEIINVIGKKEPDYVIKRTNGEDIANRYDYFYVKKPNKYGIKWVICRKNSWHGEDISASNNLPKYHSLDIIKLYK